MDQERFKQKVVPLRGQLLALAGRLLGDADEAGDVVQETFLKLWTEHEGLERVRNLPAFAFRMVIFHLN